MYEEVVIYCRGACSVRCGEAWATEMHVRLVGSWVGRAASVGGNGGNVGAILAGAQRHTYAICQHGDVWHTLMELTSQSGHFSKRNNPTVIAYWMS